MPYLLFPTQKLDRPYIGQGLPPFIESNKITLC